MGDDGHFGLRNELGEVRPCGRGYDVDENHEWHLVDSHHWNRECMRCTYRQDGWCGLAAHEGFAPEEPDCSRFKEMFPISQYARCLWKAQPVGIIHEVGALWGLSGEQLRAFVNAIHVTCLATPGVFEVEDPGEMPSVLGALFSRPHKGSAKYLRELPAQYGK